jgi:hypothetical protein
LAAAPQGSTTAPAAITSAGASLSSVLVLRAAQMLLMLAVAKVTHARLSADDFVLFNTVLFGMGIASACFSPSLRALWRAGGDRGVALHGGAVNVLVSIAVVSGVVLLNRQLFALNPLPMALGVVAAAAVYAAAKAVERMIYAFGFQRQQYRTGFGPSFVFGAAELAAAGLLAAPVNLIARLLAPVAVFAAAVGAGLLVRRPLLLGRVPSILAGGHRLFRAEHLSRAGGLSILYTVLFTTAGMLERIYPGLIHPAETGGNIERVTDYLLVLSYGLAFQSLLSISVDWARPRILSGGSPRPAAGRTVVLTAGLIVGAGALGCVVGYPLFRALHLTPSWVGPGLWSLVVARFTAQVLLYFCHVDLVVSGRLGRAAVPWALVIALQAVLIGGQVSVRSFRGALVPIVVATTAMAAIEGFLLMRRLRAGAAGGGGPA